MLEDDQVSRMRRMNSICSGSVWKKTWANIAWIQNNSFIIRIIIKTKI